MTTLIEALRNGRQIDEDGIEVAVSREAVCTAADELDRQAISEASLDTSQSHACTWPACKSEAVEQEPTFDEVMLLAAACMTDAASAAFAGYGNLSNQEIDALAARATAMLVDFNSVAALEKAVRNLTSPPAREWTGLTEDEAHVCFKSANVWHAVEAKLKEKNDQRS